LSWIQEEKTSELVRNSRKEVALIADKGRILPVLSQFSDECKQAKEKAKKIIDDVSVHVKFHREPLNHFI
jgi:hypothetical protein